MRVGLGVLVGVKEIVGVTLIVGVGVMVGLGVDVTVIVGVGVGDKISTTNVKSSGAQTIVEQSGQSGLNIIN